MPTANENLEVFIVDDDDMSVFLHEVIVKESNFHPAPKSFYNGNDIKEHFNTYFNVKKHYCVFLDLNMPIFDGWEVLEYLKMNAMDKNISVIILTSSIDQAEKKKAENYEMVIDFIEKPLSENHIDKLKKHEKFQAFF